MASSTPSLVDLLSLFDAYSKTHADASAKMKKSIWNLTKARREKGGFHMGQAIPFSAADVREELRAHALLETLVETDATKIIGGEKFILHLDGMPKKDEDRDVTVTNSDSVDCVSLGLRQRRNESSDKKETPDSVWTEENNDYIDPFEEEEKRLGMADPLDLFGGISPPALKMAQKEARGSLQYYIDAANIAVQISALSSDLESESSN